MIFVDTGALYAASVPRDSDHEKAVAWLKENRKPLLVTDYIISEVLTLLRSRGEGSRAIGLGERLFGGRSFRVHYVSEHELGKAWGVFKKFDDKEWSFTDCVSRVVMEQFGISEAFAFDEHFRQFGTVTVVP